MRPLSTPLFLALGATLLLTPAAHAATGGGATATGPKGQTLSISQADGLAAAGTTLTAIGRGYDTGKGVYVAFCKDNGPGKVATPCGGGADTSGKTGGSQWISSNPPPYGKGLAVPFGPGGTFNVEIKVSAKLTDALDCTEVKCVVTTRADHTRTSDRSQDVRVPVTFDDGSGGPLPFIIGGGVAIGLLAVGGGILVTRRRRARAAAAPASAGAAA
ncbi:hypothetical protein [Spirillospora sp. NPDC047279]|uniref:hypothetical protein n=1 Tax=Spirillospora sp. NPDC047279 TaxID=3155478 RepID=UPI0033DBB190